MRKEREEILTSSSSLEIPEKHSFDAIPVCSPDTGALQAVAMATCDSDHPSCLIGPPSAEADLTAHECTSEDAELSITPPTTCVEPTAPMQQTAATLVSPVSHSADMSTLSALVDQCSPGDRTLISHSESTASEREASEPTLSLVLDALTPVLLADTLADHSSPSFRGKHSDHSTIPTTPLSSPGTEFDSTNANGEAGEGTADIASEAYDFPMRIMSSPGLDFGRGSTPSSSPPQKKATGDKRSAYDSCDEVRRYRCLAGASYSTQGRIGLLEGP